MIGFPFGFKIYLLNKSKNKFVIEFPWFFDFCVSFQGRIIGY